MVAVVAVLVGIAIPVFRNKVEKAREAYDIATMRQAAGLNRSSAGGTTGNNAYGAYDPGSGRFYPSRGALPASAKTYGKGTSVNGKTSFTLGNPSGAYAPDQDYTNAVVMVAIYPNAKPARADIYWKNNKGNTNYVGGQAATNIPKYSISIILD